MENGNGLRIIGLTAENFKCLRAVRINPDPDAPLVVISGENGAGKSSVLDALEAALGGKDALPDEPIRRGERKARCVVDLGDLVIERVITQGSSKLVVKNREGAEQRAPQGILDALVSKVTFDPLAFASMEKRQQADVLRGLVGLDFAEHDRKRADVAERRKVANRELRAMEGKLEALPPRRRDVPEQETPIQDVLAELKAAQQVQADNQAVERAAKEAERQARLAEEAVFAARDATARAREALRLAETREDEATQARAEAEEAARLAAEKAAHLPDPGIAAIEARLGGLEDQNHAVRTNLRRKAVEDEIRAAEERSSALDAEIGRLDGEKQAALESASYPVAGLGLSDDGVTLDGLPFSQASTAQKIRTSVAIGAALNPRLRVLLVRSGNDLDRKRLALLAETAAELDLQLWVERIEPGGTAAVVIEDGEVVDGATEAAE